MPQPRFVLCDELPGLGAVAAVQGVLDLSGQEPVVLQVKPVRRPLFNARPLFHGLVELLEGPVGPITAQPDATNERQHVRRGVEVAPGLGLLKRGEGGVSVLPILAEPQAGHE